MELRPGRKARPGVEVDRMKKFADRIPAWLLAAALLLTLSACSAGTPAGPEPSAEPEKADGEELPVKTEDSVRSAVDFDHELDAYEPKKDHYRFYFTYKTVHPWWDAVALGMEEAQRQYLDRGVAISYEYMAPEGASAQDQTRRLREAQNKDYDVIGVDVADEKIISPILDEMV